MNPYLFSILIGGIGGGALGYLIAIVRNAPVFGIVKGMLSAVCC